MSGDGWIICLKEKWDFTIILI